MSMSTGSVSTYNPWQQIFQLAGVQAMAPHIDSTYKTMGALGRTAESAYNPVDFQRFIKQSYVDPIQYQLKNDLQGLQHTNERFSMGRKVREANAMNDANNKMNQLIGQTMMQYRTGAVQGLEKAYGNQLNALSMMNQAMASPLAQQGQENYTYQKDLLSSLFG